MVDHPQICFPASPVTSTPSCMLPPKPHIPTKRPDTPRYGRITPPFPPVLEQRNLPLASVVQKENLQKLQEAKFTEKDAKTRETRHRLKEIQQLKAQALYEDFLWEQVYLGIQRIRHSKIPLTSVRLPAVEAKIATARFENIPVHYLHYGAHGSTRHWCDRRPHCGPSAFFTVKKEVFARGYYLLDESDPSKSHQIHIRLHCEQPLDYNSRDKLWHGMNW